MLTFLFLTVFPLLSHAQDNQQVPLREVVHDLVVPLTFSEDRTYNFETGGDGSRRLSTKAIAEIESYRDLNPRPSSVLIHIPMDTTQPGTLRLDLKTSSSAHSHESTDWVDTLVPGEDVPITHVGIRKGAMVSMDAYRTSLALDTPYISLPNEIYDILIQATSPAPHQHSTGYDDVVDCSLMGRFPDLVLGLQADFDDDDEDDEDVEIQEIVITPEQYILRTDEGQCVLLVQQDRAKIVLGWAAVRGRDVVLDWVNKRTGFMR